MTTEEQQLVERLREFAVHLEPAGEPYADEISDLREAADTITRLVEEAAAPPVGALKAIADIREVTGLGAKPMLTELAAAVKTLLSKYAYERDAKHQMFLYEAEKHSEWLEKCRAAEARAAASEAKVAELQEALSDTWRWQADHPHGRAGLPQPLTHPARLNRDHSQCWTEPGWTTMT